MPAIVFLFAGMARSYTMPFHLFAGRFDRLRTGMTRSYKMVPCIFRVYYFALCP